MKNLLVSLCLILATLIPTNSFAGDDGEDDERRRRRRRKGGNVGLALNLAPVYNGVYSLNAEFGLSKNFSAVVSAGFLNFPVTSSVSGIGGTESSIAYFRGYMLAPEVRYYFNPSRKPGLDGFYGGVYAKVRSMGTEDDAIVQFVNTGTLFNPNYVTQRYGASYFGISAGITAGYTHVWKSGLTLGIWGGLGYFFVNDMEYTERPLVDISAFLAIDPRTGLSIGYRF